MHGRDEKNQHDKLGFFGGGLKQGEDEQLLGVYDFGVNNFFFILNTLVLMLNGCGVGRRGVQG